MGLLHERVIVDLWAPSPVPQAAQTVLPGRVPDPVDVAAGTVGTVLGVAVTAVLLALPRLAAAHRHRPTDSPARSCCPPVGSSAQRMLPPHASGHVV